MLDLEGLSVSAQEQAQLAHPAVGGVILFSRNFESPGQLQILVQQIRQFAPNCIVAVDHEGGRVQRFREGFTVLPAMSAFGRLFHQDPKFALQLCHDCGWLMASELACFDIDISFAPVLDRDYGISNVIGDRAFSAQPEALISLASAFISGMQEAGMSSTGKHFPGHGGVEADSHHEIPVDTRQLDVLLNEDVQIFKSLISAGLSAVMPAHVIYPEVDAQPAGFSRYWLQDILRKQLHFEGVIFSDDLGMEGASVAGSFSKRAAAALDAGCDMVLVCNNPEGTKQVLAYLDEQPVKPNARLGMMRLHREQNTTMEQLQKLPRWQSTHDQLAGLMG